MAGRPPGSLNKDKPFRDAIRMEAKLAENGEECTAPRGSLRWIARSLLLRAGEETAASREVGDRLDGKPAQILAGDKDNPLEIVSTVTRRFIDGPRSGDRDGGSIPPTDDA
jgi:hypothetical protein